MSCLSSDRTPQAAWTVVYSFKSKWILHSNLSRFDSPFSPWPPRRERGIHGNTMTRCKWQTDPLLRAVCCFSLLRSCLGASIQAQTMYPGSAYPCLACPRESSVTAEAVAVFIAASAKGGGVSADVVAQNVSTDWRCQHPCFRQGNSQVYLLHHPSVTSTLLSMSSQGWAPSTLIRVRGESASASRVPEKAQR